MKMRQRKRQQFYGYYTRPLWVTLPKYLVPQHFTTDKQRTEWLCNLLLEECKRLEERYAV